MFPIKVDGNCTGTYHAKLTGKFSNFIAVGALLPLVSGDGTHCVVCTEDNGIGENDVYNGTIGMDGISANMSEMTTFSKYYCMC